MAATDEPRRPGDQTGGERREGDGEDSRYHEQRRQPALWQVGNGSLVKLAGSITAAIVIGAFLMRLLGFTLVGSATGIAQNTASIEANKISITSLTLSSAANTAAIAAAVATNVSQERDIVDLKAAMSASLFMQCAMYQKLYAGAPTISECVRTNSSP